MHILHITLARLRRDDGQDLIEYALLTSLIAVVAYAAVSSVGQAVTNSFWSVIAATIPK